MTMNMEVASNKRFLDTTAQKAADDWDELLISQVDVTLASELSMLFDIDAFRNARTVIDAGCGNGYYLSKLASFFADKSYAGIDISPALAAAAASRYPGIAFRAADFFDNSAGPADVVLMRFLVQHLGDFGAILRQAAKTLEPGGALIIIESDLSRSSMRPLPSVFYRMLLRYGEVSAADGGIKGALLHDVRELIDDTSEPWALAEEKEATTTLVGPFVGHDLVKVFRLWVDLAERSSMFEFDFDAVRGELDDWARDPNCFVKLVTRMFVLEPAAR